MASALGTLIIVIAVLLLAWWCTRQLAGRTRLGMQSGYIRVLDRVSIAQDKMILLIQVGDRCYLTGVSSSSITTLAEITDELTPYEVEGENENAGVMSGIDFKEVLKKLGGSKKDGQ